MAKSNAFGNGSRIHILKEKCSDCLSGIFMEQGTMGRVKPTGYNAIDQLFLFFAKIIDPCCGNVISASMTGYCIAYVDLCEQNLLTLPIRLDGIEVVEFQRHMNSLKRMA